MPQAPTRPHLLWLQVSQSFGIQLAMSVFYPFLKQQFSFGELSLQSLVQYSIPLILLPFLRVIWVRRFILLAFALSIVRMLITTRIDTSLELYGAAVLAGSMPVFFWIPYEITYFRQKTGHGQSSAWYFGSASVSSVLAPLLAGFIADTSGYRVLFLVAALVMTFPILLASRLPDEPVRETLRASLDSVRGIRHLIFFDGFLLSAAMCLLGLSLLTFTNTATSFGTVGSLAMLSATLLSLAVARISDATNNRLSWITWTSVASAILLLLLGWQTSFWWFSFFLIVYTSVRVLAQPIVNALPMDLRLDHTKLYIARQFLLSLGRVTGFGLTWACVYLSGLKPMYAIYALGFLVYAWCVRRVLQKT